MASMAAGGSEFAEWLTMDEKERLAALDVEVRTLRETIRELRSELLEKADKDSRPIQIVCPVAESTSRDHEKRIRNVEMKLYMGLGFILAVELALKLFWK